MGKVIRHINSMLTKAYLLLIDIAIIFFMPILALVVRLEGDFSKFELYLDLLLDFLPLTIPVTLVVFYLFGLYSRLWRYATVQDLLAVVGASLVSTAIITAMGLYQHLALPRSIYVISCIFKIAAVASSRLVIKLAQSMNSTAEADNNTRFLIVGAGDAGAMIAREIKQRSLINSIVGFVDDDTNKVGKKILGTPIIGITEDIEGIAKSNNITEIIIAIPSADGETIRRISALCRGSGCRVRILPGIYELIEGKDTVAQLRDIDINDLLRRDSVEFSNKKPHEYVTGKTVLITGAGGSIGSELVRQIARLQPRTIFLLGRGENSIYEIHSEIIMKHPDIDSVPIIADVADTMRIQQVFGTYKPDIVFHAAAHKHVPLMEAQPSEAVKVNVFGTKNIVEAAHKNNVEIFVMISTDKAVNPTNVMGASKRTAELIVQNANSHSQTKFLAVRFGNVLGSRGSVIPLFRKQIAMGGPITITHPDVIRYFMTIPEAAQLVLQAGSMAEGGEVFLLDMGKPVRILDMARDLIELHGLVPDKDIKIVFTGLRPGEKLYEELLTSEEGAEDTSNKKIYKAKLKVVDEQQLQDYLGELKLSEDKIEIIKTMSKWLASYKSTSLERSGDYVESHIGSERLWKNA